MRYIILVLLNLPLVLLAFINGITLFKLNKISRLRFMTQTLVWLVILIVLVGSFPFYNYLNHRPILDSHELSLFDIIQTVAIVFLLYITNNQRRKVDQLERRVRDLHQEVSIKLSEK